MAAVLDLATRKIVGWAMRDHMRTELPLAAMMMAAQRQRPAPGLVCHSDRGSQYAAGAYADHLAAMGAVTSMSRTGNCYDNAPMESFFHTLEGSDKFAAGTRLRVPTAVAAFPDPVFPPPPRSQAEKTYDVVQWTDMAAGGHFAALEEPELLLADMRRFFASVG